jgi:hypothetical protein
MSAIHKLIPNIKNLGCFWLSAISIRNYLFFLLALRLYVYKAKDFGTIQYAVVPKGLINMKTNYDY